nr:hypothetical protein Iba_chr03eCG8830 [Ipomoea batatas]
MHYSHKTFPSKSAIIQKISASLIQLGNNLQSQINSTYCSDYHTNYTKPVNRLQRSSISLKAPKLNLLEQPKQKCIVTNREYKRAYTFSHSEIYSYGIKPR